MSDETTTEERHDRDTEAQVETDPTTRDRDRPDDRGRDGAYRVRPPDARRRPGGGPPDGGEGTACGTVGAAARPGGGTSPASPARPARPASRCPARSVRADRDLGALLRPRGSGRHHGRGVATSTSTSTSPDRSALLVAGALLVVWGIAGLGRERPARLAGRRAAPGPGPPGPGDELQLLGLVERATSGPPDVDRRRPCTTGSAGSATVPVNSSRTAWKSSSTPRGDTPSKWSDSTSQRRRRASPAGRSPRTSRARRCPAGCSPWSTPPPGRVHPPGHPVRSDSWVSRIRPSATTTTYAASRCRTGRVRAPRSVPPPARGHERTGPPGHTPRRPAHDVGPVLSGGTSRLCDAIRCRSCESVTTRTIAVDHLLVAAGQQAVDPILHELPHAAVRPADHRQPSALPPMRRCRTTPAGPARRTRRRSRSRA